MKNSAKLMMTPFIFLFCLTFFNKNASAQKVNYHTYKYGTHQTSMANGYYARPAEVKADGKKYLVTMTIRTKKSLSPYPVIVLSIDNQSPLNVQKKRHGSDYDYQYSFETADLKHEISSKIKINVPGVYKATHNISFVFDNHNLPKLSSASSHHAGHVKNEHENTDNDADVLAQAKRQSQLAAQKQAALAKERMAQNIKNRLDNERNQKMFYYMILGGILTTLVLIVAAVFFVISARSIKKKQPENKKDKK